MSSSVFLSNVDDYLAPSQACVNPMFSEKTNEGTAAASTPAVVGSVVPRRRRPRAANQNPNQPPTALEEHGDPVKASIADCLACSGCVTTAETVLLEETHSLQLLRDRAWQQSSSSSCMVATISPAAWADLLRDVPIMPEMKTGVESYRLVQRQWVTLLAETLGFTHVLDGNLPLQWSLEASAEEFCRNYSQQHKTQQETKTSMLSSSCPAVVCLVEKSSHGAVPYLSITPSPQGMAGTFWKSLLAEDECFHVAIMPCHDKKLEASRAELLDPSKTEKQVDLVLTTQDCVKLILERLGTDDKAALQSRLQQVVPCQVLEMDDLTSTPNEIGVSTPSTLLVPPLSQVEPTQGMEEIFVYGSGGYADYIFRHACRTLFDVSNLPDALPWKPVTASNGRRVSARVAAASVQRDYYQVSLYKKPDGSYSLEAESETDVAVLSFAIAYGMQTLQRVLQPYEKADAPRLYHYVESMACPSGCINGGGQLRLANRERPSQTKERVQLTRASFQRPLSAAPLPSWTKPPPVLDYRAVPPLELSQGAVKGVAVKDVQW
eukprot:scaffold8450_cov215-Amphora_coffeaeformis.AAC.5